MKKFKLRSNKAVMLQNYNLVVPNLSHDEFKLRTFSLTEKEEVKLNKLRAKYKVSRSSLIRILLNSAE